MQFVPGPGSVLRAGGLFKWLEQLRMPSAPTGFSLRSKALIGLVALGIYVLLAAFLVEQQRLRLRPAMSDLAAVHQLDDSISQAYGAASHAIVEVHDTLLDTHRAQRLPDLTTDVGALLDALQPLVAADTANALMHRDVADALLRVRVEGSVPALVALRDSLYRTSTGLDQLRANARAREAQLRASYDRIYDSVTWLSIILGMLGVTVFGAFIMLFFARLATDIKRLEALAGDIVAGKHGRSLPVTRTDELGSLMRSVNGMGEQLAQRERALELSRRNYAHQEKMVAIGSLAAGIAHEIGNPIAAISGIAQSICDVRHTGACPNHGVVCQPELILEQTRRIATITREISGFAAPGTQESELLDVNALVRSTCSFVRYDRRFRHIDLVMRLDSQLPAVRAVPDKLVQIFMNLLINAADALDNLQGRAPRLEVATEHRPGEIHIAVQDNGCGMSDVVRSRAFEAFYTTKPPGKGTGLGLALCESLAREMGATIALDSTPGQGTRVSITFPESSQEALFQ